MMVVNDPLIRPAISWEASSFSASFRDVSYSTSRDYFFLVNRLEGALLIFI